MDYVLDNQPQEAGIRRWHIEDTRVTSGIGFIQGTLTVNNNVITEGTVSIFEEVSNLHVNSMQVTNGVFRFDNLNENILYYIVVKTGDKEHKVQSRIVPAI